ncbi:MAG: hypothetical protein M1269_12890 [Chloroflexi bacterium]|nr:hypothetical protein [Chloroflexota bacterium]
MIDYFQKIISVPNIITAIIVACITYYFTSRSKKIERKAARLRQQIDELYAPVTFFLNELFGTSIGFIEIFYEPFVEKVKEFGISEEYIQELLSRRQRGEITREQMTYQFLDKINNEDIKERLKEELSNIEGKSFELYRTQILPKMEKIIEIVEQKYSLLDLDDSRYIDTIIRSKAKTKVLIDNNTYWKTLKIAVGSNLHCVQVIESYGIDDNFLEHFKEKCEQKRKQLEELS